MEEYDRLTKENFERIIFSEKIGMFSKLMFLLCIYRFKYTTQHLVTGEYTAYFKFNYWNPLTYIHLLIMLIAFLVMGPYMLSWKDLFEIIKEELINGFSFEL